MGVGVMSVVVVDDYVVVVGGGVGVAVACISCFTRLAHQTVAKSQRRPALLAETGPCSTTEHDNEKRNLRFTENL